MPSASPMPDQQQLDQQQPDQQQYLQDVRRALPADTIIYDPRHMAVYETDGLTAKKQKPWLVLLPETIEQVQAAMRLAHGHGIPVVARGAGTGLSGGAMPHPDGILLSLARFNRILAVDEDNLSAVVQPGVTNLSITEHVRDRGLYYAPDPSSQIACSIGGNVAENSGGVHCLKYGLTVHNVLKLKLVSPEGEIYEVGADSLDAPGFDLLALLHGSEGMLGIVVEVTVKLLPKPGAIVVFLAGFDSVSRAGESVGAIIAEGIVPAGLEMMDKMAVEAAEAFVKVGYPLAAEALLLCELDGAALEVESQLARLEALMTRCGATSFKVARSQSERDLLWKGRKAAFPAVGRIAPDYYCMDGTIPRRELGAVLDEIAALSRRFELAVANVFHAGDGNLHPLILFDANKPGETDRAEALGAAILELCIERGGTITGEHGVGVEKIDQMCVQFTDDELAMFHDVKAAFDESGILNPGKAVPTLNRCAEFGAMHVHAGNEKFPGLERF
jgi:glycolate oxidase